MSKEKLTLWIEKGLCRRLKRASLEETGSMKGISKCISEAIEEWLSKKERNSPYKIRYGSDCKYLIKVCEEEFRKSIAMLGEVYYMIFIDKTVPGKWSFTTVDHDYVS